jgi:hypothetical protein
LDSLSRAVVEFHREIGRAAEDEVDPKWFELSIALKKKLKKMQDSQKVNEKPRLEKKPSIVVDFPEALLAGRGPNDQQMLKSIYKNFVTNYEEAGRDSATVGFVQSVLRELKYMFEGTYLVTQRSRKRRCTSESTRSAIGWPARVRGRPRRRCWAGRSLPASWRSTTRSSTSTRRRARTSARTSWPSWKRVGLVSTTR